jgi:hypothetical protein
MLRTFQITAGLLLLPIIAGPNPNQEFHLRSTQLVAKQRQNVTGGCMTQIEVAASLRQLSTSKSTGEQQKIVATLREAASSSAGCRKQVVMVLITALRNSNRDLLLDRPSFFLWHYGSKLLADLKAVEALDLFVTNLDLHDGTPFPFNHYPAIGAVIDLGEEAIPSLKSLLTEDINADARRYAVFCLAQIGGKVAKKVLQERLAFESNCCIRNSITSSLKAFRNKTLPNRITSENRTEWYGTFMCDCDPAMRITITAK